MFESTEKSPTISTIMLYLAVHISKLETMYKVLVENINFIFQTTVLFTHTNEIKIPELANADTNMNKNHQRQWRHAAAWHPSILVA